MHNASEWNRSSARTTLLSHFSAPLDILMNPYHSQEWSISSFACSLTRNITSQYGELGLSELTQAVKDYDTTDSHYLTHTCLFNTLWEYTFWTREWKGQVADTAVSRLATAIEFHLYTWEPGKRVCGITCMNSFWGSPCVRGGFRCAVLCLLLEQMLSLYQSSLSPQAVWVIAHCLLMPAVYATPTQMKSWDINIVPLEFQMELLLLNKFFIFAICVVWLKIAPMSSIRRFVEVLRLGHVKQEGARLLLSQCSTENVGTTRSQTGCPVAEISSKCSTESMAFWGQNANVQGHVHVNCLMATPQRSEIEMAHRSCSLNSPNFLGFVPVMCGKSRNSLMKDLTISGQSGV